MLCFVYTSPIGKTQINVEKKNAIFDYEPALVTTNKHTHTGTGRDRYKSKMKTTSTCRLVETKSACHAINAIAFYC